MRALQRQGDASGVLDPARFEVFAVTTAFARMLISGTPHRELSSVFCSKKKRLSSFSSHQSTRLPGLSVPSRGESRTAVQTKLESYCRQRLGVASRFRTNSVAVQHPIK